MPELITAAIYGRVSTVHQDYARQVDELRDYAGRMGWQSVEYLEKESAKMGSQRPEHQRLMADAALKKFQVVLVAKVDRFGRSLKEFIENVLTLDRLDIRFVATSGGIDTDKRNPFTKLLMNLLAMFAEFELDMIRERTNGGLQRYRTLYRQGRVGTTGDRQSKSGKNLPVGRPTKIFRRDLAREMRAAGQSWNQISEALGVNKSTVRKALKTSA